MQLLRARLHDKAYRVGNSICLILSSQTGSLLINGIHLYMEVLTQASCYQEQLLKRSMA